MDVVARTKRHPRPGETVFGQELHLIPGGKGSNQAVAASRLSEHVHLVGKLGRDHFGEALAEFLQQERLHLDHLSVTDKHPTGVALITVNEDAENTIVVVSGSNDQLLPLDVEKIELTAEDVVVSVFEIRQETILALFARAKQAGACTILNPAPATEFAKGLLPLVDYLVVNETELAYFAAVTDAGREMAAIPANAQRLRTTADQAVVVTLGAKGVVCVQGETIIRVPGRVVKAVDTTGAGDCFTGALAVALLEGRPLKKALHFANLAASLCVQKLGAAAAMPYRHEVDQALAF